jgi:ribonuclease T2
MRMVTASAGGAVLLTVLAGSAAHADVPMSGVFTAAQACPAYQSMRKATNPGGAAVEPNKAYDVLAKNKPNATAYRILVEGAQPEERWVSASCGRVEADERPTRSVARSAATTAATGVAGGVDATHVLAMSWEPSFCEKHSDKSECRELTQSSFATTHLSLHGLWPQPRGTQYCNVGPADRTSDENHDWNSLPEPELSAETLKRLAAVMPGVQSKLQRHEWIVHGTCFGGNADGYFARAAALAEAVDASKVSQLFAGNAGRSLSADAIRAAFDDAFGAGAGARVTVSCSGKRENRRITELQINLAGDVKGSASLGDLMRAAQAVRPGCPAGLVDSAPN